jgi:diacylglycerol kinase family enzyme
MTAAPALSRRVPDATRTHVRVLVNPSASRLRERDVGAVIDALRARFTVTTARTEAAGHATALAREAADAGCGVVAVLGGDGTVSQAASGLVGSPTAMACLPAGVTNVFARSLGIPNDPVRAATHLVRLAEGGRLRARAVDVGTVNGRHFLYTSGVGFTATMAEAAERAPERKARLGQLHFALAGVSEIAGRYLRDPPRMRVQSGDLDEEGVTVIVQNCRALTYFGPSQIRLSAAAGLETGGLSLTMLQSARPLDVASVILQLLSGRATRLAEHRAVAARPMLREATVTPVDGGGPLPVDADGEYLGAFEQVAFGVQPGALRVVS